MTLPEYVIQDILKKFGPRVEAYLRAVGFFDVKGPYEPLDLIQPGPMKKYVLASKAKNRAVWEFLESTLLKEMGLSSTEFARAYGLAEVWNVSDIAEKYFRPRAGATIKLMTATDKKLLTNFIFSNSGMNERPLARAILKQPNLSSIVDNSGFRARRITRTERHRMTWGSSLEFAKGAGSQTKKWATVGDGRVRPAHQNLNDEIVGIEEAFSDGEQYPGEHDINCRCHLEYGFEKKPKEAFVGLSDAQLEEIYA
ncbi:MAG: phage minor head protein [Synergistaceae bacterium]|jgi:hypothetical protein